MMSIPVAAEVRLRKTRGGGGARKFRRNTLGVRGKDCFRGGKDSGGEAIRKELFRCPREGLVHGVAGRESPDSGLPAEATWHSDPSSLA